VTTLLSTQPPSALTGASALTRPGTGPRTRTPSAIKWLLNERAALAGKAQRLEAELQRIQRELPAVQEKLAALDTTLELLDKSVAPDAAGAVNAWAGKYGARGAVKDCVLSHLQSAGKSGIDVSTLAQQVAAALGVELPTKKDFSAFRRDTVHAVLKRAKANGLVEILLATRGGHTPQVWRWKGPKAMHSLAQLREISALSELAEIANKGVPGDADQDARHREVAAQ